MTSIEDIDKGDHLCTPRPLYFHHFIVTANYVKEGHRPGNGKEFEIIEFNGPQRTTKARVVAAQKSLSDYEELYKVTYSHGEAFDSGKIHIKLILVLSFMKIFCHKLLEFGFDRFFVQSNMGALNCR